MTIRGGSKIFCDRGGSKGGESAGRQVRARAENFGFKAKIVKAEKESKIGFNNGFEAER